MLKTTFPNRPDIVRTANEIDRMLIEILCENGRAIGRDFTQRTQLSEATISRRLASLEESKLVRVRGYVDLQDSGCNSASIIRFSTKSSLDSFAQALAKSRCFYRVATVAGENQVIALVAAATPTKLLAEIDSVLAAHQHATIEQSSEILSIIPPQEARRKFDRHSSNAPEDKTNTPRRCQVHSDTIRALQQDYRVHIARLAEMANISSPAASAKIREVINDQDIRPLVVVDPHFMARTICALLRVSVRRNIQKTAKVISDKFNPDWIFICLQTEQILVEISVADEVDLHRYRQELSNIAEVTSVASSPFSAVYKQTFDWNCDQPTHPAS